MNNKTSIISRSSPRDSYLNLVVLLPFQIWQELLNFLKKSQRKAGGKSHRSTSYMHPPLSKNSYFPLSLCILIATLDAGEAFLFLS